MAGHYTRDPSFPFRKATFDWPCCSYPVGGCPWRGDIASWPTPRITLPVTTTGLQPTFCVRWLRAPYPPLASGGLESCLGPPDAIFRSLQNRHLVPVDIQDAFSACISWFEEFSSDPFQPNPSQGQQGSNNGLPSWSNSLVMQSWNLACSGIADLTLDMTRTAVRGEESHIESAKSGLDLLAG